MKIRKSTSKDLNELVKLYWEHIKYAKKTFRYLRRVIGSNLTNNVIRKCLRSYISHPKDSIVLVSEDKKINGFVSATIDSKKRINKKKFVEIIDIYVHTRRKGIGQMLLNETIKWAKKKGAMFIVWEYESNNKLADKFLNKNRFETYRLTKIKKLR